MLGFFILKPDMFHDWESVQYYLDFINGNAKLELLDFYRIRDWISLSKLLYEPQDVNLPLNELREIRRRMLITIKGYEEFYKDEEAVLSLFNMRHNTPLQELYDFKKQLRKKFVMNTRRCYMKFDDECSLDLNCTLKDCDTSKVHGSYIVSSDGTEITEKGYDMIFFNKIHFCDAGYECLKRDMSIVESQNIISQENIIRTLRCKEER